MIIIGFLCLVALFFYEAFMPLKEPLIPMHVSNTIKLMHVTVAN